MLHSWEGNRRSGIALVMRHRLCGFIAPVGSKHIVETLAGVHLCTVFFVHTV